MSAASLASRTASSLCPRASFVSAASSFSMTANSFAVYALPPASVRVRIARSWLSAFSAVAKSPSFAALMPATNVHMVPPL